MGKMATKAALIESRYDKLPRELRERFEEKILATVEGLSVVEEIKQHDPGLNDEVMELAMMAFADGKIAGNWPKVHRELATGSPRLYAVIGSRLPRDEGSGL